MDVIWSLYYPRSYSQCRSLVTIVTQKVRDRIFEKESYRLESFEVPGKSFCPTTDSGHLSKKTISSCIKISHIMIFTHDYCSFSFTQEPLNT